MCEGLVFICDCRKLLGNLCSVPLRQLLSQRRYCQSYTVFAWLYNCWQRFNRELVVQSMHSGHFLYHRRCQWYLFLRPMSCRSVLPLVCGSFSLPVSRRQLLQQCRRVATRVVPARLVCPFNRFQKLLGLSVWDILQRQRHSAASAVSSRLFVPRSEGCCAHAVFDRLLLSFRRHVQRAAVSNRPLLPTQWTRICRALSRWLLLITIWSIVARHLHRMPVR
jgi:hypothetical protein